MSFSSVNDIVEGLYFSKSHRDYCKTLCNGDGDLSEDLFGDAITDLLEKGDEKLRKVYDNGKMETYFACVIRYKHLTKLKKDKLFERYSGEEIFSGAECHTEDHDSKMDYAMVEKALNQLYFYHRGILLLYLKYESYKKVSDATKIPYYSVFFGVREARRMLKKIVYGG